MKLASSEQMRKIDREAMDQYGIPGIILMENAGIKVYQNIIKRFDINSRNICIVCGSGNNGGDGFVVARHLSFTNKNVKVWLVGDGSRVKGDALVNYNIVRNMGIDIRHIINEDDLYEFADDVRRSHILIDGLLGTGVKGEVTGFYRDVIDIINKDASYVISIDIPSGINADTGRVEGPGVRADITITFALPKIGLFTHPGAEYAGEVVVEDISIPGELIKSQYIDVNIVTAKDFTCGDFMHMFQKRKKDSNKGTYGRAYIIGGSQNMMGAAAMCTLSALRCGAGIVELAVPACIQERIAPLVMEAIVRGLNEENGVISPFSTSSILNSLKYASSYAIGPGLSKTDGLLKLLEDVVENAQIPGVIDADGLNLLSQNIDILYKAKNTLVLTPHPKEMSRLTGRDVEKIQSDRIGCSREFSMKYNVVTVLKGANTVIACPDGRVFINTTGNPGMAKGGSGDVLTGIIVSLMAQGMKPFEAAVAGVYIHGLAGDMACDKFGEYGMKAGDIIEYISWAIKEISQS